MVVNVKEQKILYSYEQNTNARQLATVKFTFDFKKNLQIILTYLKFYFIKIICNIQFEHWTRLLCFC